MKINVDTTFKKNGNLSVSTFTLPSSVETSWLILLEEVPKWATLAQTPIDEVIDTEMEIWMELEQD